mmetsp:Transcript_32610/g.76849  ORF Transcript_32610/g.76849 Transcript_32610/m.76849 type:complete len:258 (-) Transcript_32610:11-784(-)
MVQRRHAPGCLFAIGNDCSISSSGDGIGRTLPGHDLLRRKIPIARAGSDHPSHPGHIRKRAGSLPQAASKKPHQTKTNASFVRGVHHWKRKDMDVGSKTFRTKGVRGQSQASNSIGTESAGRLHETPHHKPRGIQLVGGSHGAFEHEETAGILWDCEFQAVCPCLRPHRRLPANRLVVVSIGYRHHPKPRKSGDSQCPVQRTLVLSRTGGLLGLPPPGKNNPDGKCIKKRRASQVANARSASKANSIEIVCKKINGI